MTTDIRSVAWVKIDPPPARRGLKNPFLLNFCEGLLYPFSRYTSVQFKKILFHLSYLFLCTSLNFLRRHSALNRKGGKEFSISTYLYHIPVREVGIMTRLQESFGYGIEYRKPLDKMLTTSLNAGQQIACCNHRKFKRAGT